jgi:hypothetical protein
MPDREEPAVRITLTDIYRKLEDLEDTVLEDRRKYVSWPQLAGVFGVISLLVGIGVGIRQLIA